MEVQFFSDKTQVSQLMMAYFWSKTHHSTLSYVAASYLIWGIFCIFCANKQKQTRYYYYSIVVLPMPYCTYPKVLQRLCNYIFDSSIFLDKHTKFKHFYFRYLCENEKCAKIKTRITNKQSHQIQIITF